MTAGIVEIVVIALISIGIGMVVWAADREHIRYGATLPAGIAVVTAMLTWVVAQAMGLDYRPGWTWVPWIAPLVLALAASMTFSLLLSRKRSEADAAQLTTVLKQF
ncbi:hypothetical protein ODZ83_02280 [Acaricomes phytoseiuli]|uniref:hypothetical protein n=1 Tax=Acaricomes phytoseiuli TaxID=291968 RepID=UPI00037B2704|nr:hypothetical protein [Acaricomes phytoseiuli]MCW1249031.1 hypothetical protein [Acaricomes phytoseiuli]